MSGDSKVSEAAGLLVRGLKLHYLYHGRNAKDYREKRDNHYEKVLGFCKDDKYPHGFHLRGAKEIAEAPMDCKKNFFEAFVERNPNAAKEDMDRIRIILRLGGCKASTLPTARPKTR